MKNDSLMLPLLFTAMIAVAAVQGAEKATVPQQTGKNWTQMSPYALVDSLYCPGQKKNRRKALPPEPLFPLSSNQENIILHRIFPKDPGLPRQRS